MATKNGVDERTLRDKVVRAFHQQINNRYQLEAIQALRAGSNGDIHAISQEDIDRAKELFLSTIYPDLEHREELEKSFDSLVRMLKNPRKLAHFIPSLPSIVLKFGASFPFALRIGLNSVIAFTLSHRIEDQMVKHVKDILQERGEHITPSFKLDEETFHEAYVRIPYAEGKKMVQVGFWVIKAGKNLKIAETAYRILNDVQSSLERTDAAAIAAGGTTSFDDDIRAIDYGKSTLRNIIDTISPYSPDVIDRLIHIANTLELNYLDRMYGKIPE